MLSWASETSLNVNYRCTRFRCLELTNIVSNKVIKLYNVLHKRASGHFIKRYIDIKKMSSKLILILIDSLTSAGMYRWNFYIDLFGQWLISILKSKLTRISSSKITQKIPSPLQKNVSINHHKEPYDWICCRLVSSFFYGVHILWTHDEFMDNILMSVLSSSREHTLMSYQNLHIGEYFR